MHEGSLMAYGSNKQVLNRDNLQKVYGMDVQQWIHSLLFQWEE
jgi:ABC-type cobalamin transport system ATPase subunit